MNLRRIGFLSIRLLSVYFFVRGIEVAVGVVLTRLRGSQFSLADAWPNLATALVPVIAAVILWAWSKRIAIALGEAEVFTSDEIVDDWAEEHLEGTAAADAAIGAPDRPGKSDGILRLGLVLMGINFAVSALRWVIGYAVDLAAANKTDPYCGRNPSFRGIQDCSGFWTTYRTQTVVALIGWAAVMFLGVALIRRSASIADFLMNRAARKKDDVVDEERSDVGPES